MSSEKNCPLKLNINNHANENPLKNSEKILEKKYVFRFLH